MVFEFRTPRHQTIGEALNVHLHNESQIFVEAKNPYEESKIESQPRQEPRRDLDQFVLAVSQNGNLIDDNQIDTIANQLHADFPAESLSLIRDTVRMSKGSKSEARKVLEHRRREKSLIELEPF